MTRVPPLPEEALHDHHEHLELMESLMGFVPNNTPVMARVPGLVDAVGAMSTSIFVNDVLPPTLRPLVALVASAAAGCRYCQGHTTMSASRLGVPDEKLAEVWDFERSEHFTNAERAALRLAVAGASVPNTATDDDFAELRKHYDEDQIATIVAVIAFFGFMNRWNETMATQLESQPAKALARLPRRATNEVDQWNDPNRSRRPHIEEPR